MTEIDGLDIHFIHVRSQHENALPIIVTHGWPGSIIEQLKIIEPLTNPTAYGGTRSGRLPPGDPVAAGPRLLGQADRDRLGPHRIARAWAVLMQRLGYTRFVAQGGDWGNAVTEQMALQTPPGLLGIHTNMPATIPDEIAKALAAGGPPPAGLVSRRAARVRPARLLLQEGPGLRQRDGATARRRCTGSWIRRSAWPPGCSTTTRPATTLIARVFAGECSRGLTRDDILDNVTLYWLTNTAVSSARLYWESKLVFFAPKGVPLPTAVTRLPGRDLRRPAQLDRAGLSQPDLIQQARPGRPLRGLGADRHLVRRSLRAAFRSLR